MLANLLSFRFLHIWCFSGTVGAQRLFLPPVVVFIARATAAADGPDASASGGLTKIETWRTMNGRII